MGAPYNNTMQPTLTPLRSVSALRAALRAAADGGRYTALYECAFPIVRSSNDLWRKNEENRPSHAHSAYD